MMSNVRESDTSLWLHNKLGSNESWSGGTISSQLNPEVLRNIKDCFIDLQTQVKLKLLLSFFHIPRRNIEEWRNELEEIIEVAQSDSEQWVAMLAEIMKPYPSTASLNHDIQEPEENKRIFLDLIDDVTQELKRGKDLNLLPLECLYLNKNALLTVVGQQLIRAPQDLGIWNYVPNGQNRQNSPESEDSDDSDLDSLMNMVGISWAKNETAEITAQEEPKKKKDRKRKCDAAAEASSVVPVPNISKVSTLAPLQNIKRLQYTQYGAYCQPLFGRVDWFTSSANLIDVGEIIGREGGFISVPVVPKESLKLQRNDGRTPPKHFTLKRKPKSVIMRADLLMKACDAAKTNAKKIPAPTIPLRTRGMPRKMTDTTPLKGIPSQAVRAPAIAPPPVSRTLSRPSAGKKEGGVKLLEITEQPMGYALAKRRKKMQEAEDSKKSNTTEEASRNNETPDYAAGLASASTIRPPTPPPPTPLMPPATPSYQPATPQPIIAPATPMAAYSRIPDGPPPTPNPQLIQQQDTNTMASSSYMPSTVNPSAATAPRKGDALSATGQPMTKTVILQVPTNQPQQIVTLSKELMEKAQEIFRTANKATRPEKEHILKFMAGTRENPCPELGSIVTIKLSEHAEPLRQKDGSLVTLQVETHFQMNYNTGEWKVIQKPPKVDNAPHPLLTNV